MARVSFVLTEDERRAFQDALGEAETTAPMPLPPDALAVLSTAGLHPTVSTVAGLMHPTITTGFDQPLEFDPGYHLETLGGDGTADHRGTAQTEPDRTFAFDVTPAVAGSVQFLLFLLAGPHRSANSIPHTALAVRAAQRIAAAVAAEFPSAPSHLPSKTAS